MYKSFLLSVAASVVATGVTYLATVVFRFRLPTIATLFFWNRFSQFTKFLISEVPIEYEPKIMNYISAPLTPMGDAVSLLRMADFFHYRLRENPDIASAQQESAFLPLCNNNLIILGGPKYNAASAHLLKKFDPYLPYQFQRIITLAPRTTDDPEMKRIVGRCEGLNDYSIDPGDEYDYGMLIVAKSPYENERYIIHAAGLSTHGTLGAINYLLSASGIELIRALWAKHGMQYIIRCRAISPVGVSRVQLLFKRGF